MALRSGPGNLTLDCFALGSERLGSVCTIHFCLAMFGNVGHHFFLMGIKLEWSFKISHILPFKLDFFSFTFMGKSVLFFKKFNFRSLRDLNLYSIQFKVTCIQRMIFLNTSESDFSVNFGWDSGS